MKNPAPPRAPAAPWLASSALAAAILVLSASTCSAPAPAPPQGEVRPPAVAGQFYPSDAGQLGAAVRAFLADAVPARGERPLALVLPHAGYVFSGQIAADGWRQAQGGRYDVVVILGTNHTTAGYGGASVYTGSGFRTPLGVAAVDTKLAAAVLGAKAGFDADPRVHEREHSIEVHVPFAQVVLPGVPILPIVVATQDPATCEHLGRALARVLAERHPLIVASSDLSHYPRYAAARTSDRGVLAAIAREDADGLTRAIAGAMGAGLPGLETCACGEGDVRVALAAARELGARRGTVLSWANSGDTAMGDHERVVGYGAVMLSAAGVPGEAGSGADTAALAPLPRAAAGDTLAPADRRALLALARRTLERWYATGTLPLARGFAPAAERDQGAFVTLTEHGELRGCIGYMAEDVPLAQNVGAMAFAAALEDRRFPPLEERELKDVEIEISALTPLARVAGPEAVVIGRDGVQIRKDGKAAVFLPQVPVEQGWSRTDLMENLCLKAGLPRDAWKSGAEFWTFRSVIFREGARH